MRLSIILKIVVVSLGFGFLDYQIIKLDLVTYVIVIYQIHIDIKQRLIEYRRAFKKENRNV